ncbi:MULTISPECIES: ABC transporter ATP-binding protein [Yersinia]|uniref:ABC transporter ATP-binding protein n=1 Tax=Yersinia intermedia TaxID=631 RepID=A0A0H5M0R7_YERIN|nr:MULTISPECIES: ABC transporter ATP-binding protein [Yersinia]MCB5309838.1 ABC transporter ATP-binding protein [Yersinia massiliensis]CRY56920.1 ABC transporter ATP-binding protein [Yersinia intermedia]
MTQTALVQFRHVRKSWQSLTAIDNFTLDIERGEFIALVGSSGCGKSTLLRLLVGLESNFQGEICIDGLPVNGIGRDRGIVFQEPRLFPWLTVEQNVALGLADAPLGRNAKRERVAHMLELVQLTGFARHLPAQLSGGMAQRVAIARGLAASPEILMLDEPFGALDALTRQQMQQELLHIHQTQKTTTLIVTHDVDEAVTLADRIVVMSPRPGRILEIVDIRQPHPRARDSDAFTSRCAHIRALITQTESFAGAH